MARTSRKSVDVAVMPVTPSRVVYKAAAYVRLSSDDTKKRGDSLETQRNIIENYIAAQSDVRLFKLYTDNNATGTNFERPGFQQMLMDIERGNVNCIIVKDLTRFGRNAIDAGYYLEKYLPALGVRFIAVTDSYDSLEGDGGILLPLKNIISESYALDIGRKCRAVQRQNIADGRFVGRLAPYGFDKSPADCRKLIVDETAAEVVLQIFLWAADGAGAGEITRRLNDAGILTPSRYKQMQGLISSENNIGREYWSKRAVVSILADRVYIGDMVQGKTRKVNHKQIDVSPDEWVTVKNTHEPIISREMFDEVQRLRILNSEQDKAIRRQAVAYTENVLGGKVICAKCGHPMHRHRQNKDGTYWFRCESQHRYSKDTCVQVSVKEADLIADVLTLLHRQAEILCGQRDVASNSAHGAGDGNDEAELRAINQGLDKDGRMLRSLYESMISGIITAAEFAELKTGYEAKIEALSKQADIIRNRRFTTASRAVESRELADAVGVALRDGKLSAEIINLLVDKILVKPDKSFEIVLKYQDEFREVS